jgi:hypothetical protein
MFLYFNFNKGLRPGYFRHVMIITGLLKMLKSLQQKEVETTQWKQKGRKKPHKPKPEEQQCMPQYQHCHPAKRRAKIGTHSTMKSSRKTLHDCSPHIPQKASKGNTSR